METSPPTCLRTIPEVFKDNTEYAKKISASNSAPMYGSRTLVVMYEGTEKCPYLPVERVRILGVTRKSSGPQAYGTNYMRIGIPEAVFEDICAKASQKLRFKSPAVEKDDQANEGNAQLINHLPGSIGGKAQYKNMLLYSWKWTPNKDEVVKKAIQKIKKNSPDAAGVVPFSNLLMLLDISPKSNTNSFEELPKADKTGEADPTESELSDESNLSEDEASESNFQVPTKSKLKVPTVEVVPPSPRKVIEDTGAQTVKGVQTPARPPPHAACRPHAYKWREDGQLGVRPRRTGVLAMHACLEGVQALHALRTGVHGWHACPARLTVPFGTLVRVPFMRVPLGTLIRGTVWYPIRVLFGTLIRVPNGTLIRVPSGTLIRVPSGTLIRVPNGTLIRVPSGTLIRVPNGTLIRVPNSTLIRVPRGSRQPLNLRGLREPGRTGVPAVHACPEGVQGLHALQTGVHGQHACPAGPHAKPAVLTPFVGVRTACGMRGRACGALEQPCLTGDWTGMVQPKPLPAGQTGLPNQFPAGGDWSQPGTDWTVPSNRLAWALVRPCLSNHRLNTAV
ncbi:hypothetical protein PCANC_18172 [Puccinia coronata f. sp. avenae]|uniref:Uncharacterized protein n=1 Tax=Puccinia coronata f. sp. avenae TaxID=200324 RepID=A0A2N5SNN5_9BASI|nr:hypothetical protein PCANC_18172 [Puccinia coronata f. sp. avenae]